MPIIKTRRKNNNSKNKIIVAAYGRPRKGRGDIQYVGET